NEATKKNIIEISKQLNYVPNFNAKSLVLNKSYNIGLFFTSINQGTTAGFFHEVIEGVNSVVKNNYNIVIRGIDDYEDYTPFDNKRFDGIIMISQSESDNDFIYDVYHKHIPMVVLNREINENNIVNILSSDNDGSYNAVNYLIQKGHKDIAIIKGKQDFKSSEDRKDGYFRAMLQSKLKIKDEYIATGEYNIESGYTAMKKLLDAEPLPTAVFCSNDDMAVGAIKAIIDRGYKVPEDVSIVGYDNSSFCSYITPSLTSVKKQTKEFSVRGAEILLKLISGEEVEKKKIYIDTELIIRESVRKLMSN
ncbi:MAG TPA: LacI family DNA-binding transcriptional regulator, partial [Clostridiaceae bacterium]